MIATMSYAFTASSALWVLTLICDRLYALHVIYLETNQQVKEEQWLRKQCEDPVFFANLKSHTDLCTQVQANAMHSVLLFSVKKVMETTYVCGSKPCSHYGMDAVNWFVGLSTPVMIMMVMLALFSPLVFVQAVRCLGWLVMQSVAPKAVPLPDAFSPYYGVYSGPGANESLRYISNNIERSSRPLSYAWHQSPFIDDMETEDSGAMQVVSSRGKKAT